MAYLSTIIKHIKTCYSINILGDIPDNRSITTVRFLDSTDLQVSYLTPDVLFIGKYEYYKDCSFSGNALLVGADSNQPKGDAIHIKEDIDLFSLLNCISDCLIGNQLLQRKKDELFNLLRHGHELNLILKKAYSYIDNPINVCDSSFSILDSYPAVSDERSLEKRNNRLSLKNVFSDDMKESKLTEHIFHSVYPFITKVDKFEYNWVFESIRINQSVVGYVCVRGNNRDFTDDDLEIIHHVTQLISIYLQKGDGFANPQGIRIDRFLKDLFLGHFDSEESIKARISSGGFTLGNYYYLVAYDFVDSQKNLLSKDYFCKQLQSIFPNAITGTFESMLVSLLPAKRPSPFNESTSDRLSTFLQMNRMIATISFVFTNLEEAPLYFEQCQCIFSMINSEENVGKILLYGQYCLRHIASRLDDPALFMATVHPALKFLEAYDRNNSTDYLNTLRTYIQKNRSAPAAAKALHIHKSTFFYRIEKMKSLFDIDISNPDNMFAYEISLRLMDIANGTSIFVI